MLIEQFSLLDRQLAPGAPGVRRRVRVTPGRSSTTGIEDDPIIAFAWPRADLDAGARELLIGLLSTACWRHVLDEDEWEAWWHEPPDPAALDACLAPLRDAFILDGPGPRFHAGPGGARRRRRCRSAGLLIDTPGANALRKNTDLFVKRGRIEALSRGRSGDGALHACRPSLRRAGPGTAPRCAAAGRCSRLSCRDRRGRSRCRSGTSLG